MENIGNWEDLCKKLEVPDSVTNELRYSNEQNEIRKRRCLEIYFKSEKACWEHVIRIICDYPFYEKTLARKLANKYIGNTNKDEL